jgi:tetratricopeptide (TPR) repeat protein
VTAAPFTVARLDEIERTGRGEWIPLRRHLDIGAFGVNVWAVADADAEIIGEHDETPTGHEELYVVIDGHAVFTVAGEEIDAPKGTAVFVRDPETKRAARTATGGATILTVGGKRGAPYEQFGWEANYDVFPLFDRGEYAEAKRRLERQLELTPDAGGGTLYNLACAEARLGERETALDHLTRAVGLEERFREPAQSDPDLESIRDDSRFPKPKP